MISLSVLGSTGSIGTQTLDVVRRDPTVRVVALSAGSRWEEALLQAKEFGVKVLSLTDPGAAAAALREKDSAGVPDLRVLSGPSGLLHCATLSEADVVMHAVPGFLGIEPLLFALRAGKQVALAGKEALVSVGETVRELTRSGSGRIVPVDSEHSAIFQCLQGEDPSQVSEIVLTASGGALRDLPMEEMEKVTPEDVLRHPTWKMGPKVTVDSATLFNKTLEVMEAHYLFGVPYDSIKVVIHRQSIVHSMVTFVDGSTKAQAGIADMRGALAYGITYPRRHAGVLPSLSPYLGTLTFEAPDTRRNPCLLLGYAAGAMGGTAPMALSLADEILVDLFLRGRLGYVRLQDTLCRVLDGYMPREASSTQVLAEEKTRVARLVSGLLP